MMYKTIRRKLKIEQRETHLKPWLNSCAQEEFVAPVILSFIHLVHYIVRHSSINDF
jgi:hypothetical protein